MGVEPTNAPWANVGAQPSGPNTPGEKAGPLLGWGTGSAGILSYIRVAEKVQEQDRVERVMTLVSAWDMVISGSLRLAR